MDSNSPSNGASVSDQSRNANGGLPTQFSSNAQANLPNTPQQPTPQPPAAVNQMPQPAQPAPPPSPVVTANPPVQPTPPTPNNITTTENMKQGPENVPQRPAPTTSLEAKVDSLTQQLSNLANIVANIATNQPAASPSDTTPVNGTNTGNMSPSMPGTGAPLAPQKHLPDNQLVAQAPDPNQPVIPEPTPGGGDPQTGVRTYVETEEDKALDDNAWIEKHFRMRDLSVDQMALALRWDPTEVINVLKERGYQFPDGV